MFIGDTQFKTPLPGNVLNRGLLPWIRNHTTTLLDSSAVQQANARLDELHRATDRKAAARDHVKTLKARTWRDLHRNYELKSLHILPQFRTAG